MKKLLYLLLLVAPAVFAQRSLPEAFTVSEDSLEYHEMPEKYWQFIDAGYDSISFKDITSPAYDKRFKNYVKQNLRFNVGDERNIWLRYRLKNADNKPLTLAINANSEDTYLFAQSGNSLSHFRNGTNVPWSLRKGIKQHQSILYTLQPQAMVTFYVYHKEVSQTGIVYPYFYNYNGLVEKLFHNNYIYQATDTADLFFAGFIAFAMVFNLLFYYVNRERVYLVYSVTLFFAALNSASLVIQHEFFAEHPQAANNFDLIITFSLLVLIVHTIRYFFRIWQYYPKWDKALVWIPPVLIVSGVIVGQTFRYMSNIVVIVYAMICLLSGLTLLVGIIVMVAAFLRRQHQSARLFVVATLPFLISMLVRVFNIYDYAMQFAGLWTILLLSWGLFARYRELQIENARVALEKEEERNRLIAEQNEQLEHQVQERTAELQQSLAELKQTQAQLIQSEKMASLGELTAGIAHEIQNPLNFVNNFSDVSAELLQELKEEAEKGDLEEVNAIADDVIQNLEKIAHHGRRADGIVKGMLQHSRTSTGQKELTDINALADEYLRLAYHGLRAKDKSFNANLVTHFAGGLPKINIISQDMGRVLLNLFNNAFYATQERSRQADSSYKPTVEVSTQLNGNSLEIVVKDNGAGIPDAVKDKILQPFFTTKPTGQGTGLGLSLSYDIVVKAHGGTIDIESAEGQGAIFKINLPINA